MPNEYTTKPLSLVEEIRGIQDLFIKQSENFQQMDMLVQMLLRQSTSLTRELNLLEQQVAMLRRELLNCKMRIAKLESNATNEEVETQRLR
ncbi:MAG: hypothetical protein M3384_10065 [Acidobacteriota bacterium]|nr:hypothetical protein [Acidobacteriota bacterium]